MQFLHILLDWECAKCYNTVKVTEMELIEIRKRKGLTQKQAAAILGVSLRSYVSYEKDPGKLSEVKYEFLCQTLLRYGVIDEEHGLLTIEGIKGVCAEVFEEYGVEYAYLFGSYAKGTATETSDVDLLVSVKPDGLAFFGLVETLREKLCKKVDVLDLAQLNNNIVLVREILKDGIKIYG